MYTSSVGMNKKPALWLQIAGIIALYAIAVSAVTGMSATRIHFALLCLPASWAGISLVVYKCVVLLLLAGNTAVVVLMLLHLNLIELRDYRSAMYYLLLHILIPDSITLPDMLTESMFLYILLPRLLEVNTTELHQANAPTGGFVFGFCCGLLALIYPPMCIVAILWLLVNIFYRNLSVKTVLLPVMGLGITILYAWAYAYIFHRVIHITPWYFRWQGQPDPMHLMEYISRFILIATMCFTLVLMLRKVGKIEMNRRKKWFVLIINYIILLPVMLLLKDSWHLYYSIWIIICSFMLNVSMYHTKSPVLRYILILLTIMALYINLV